MKKPDVYAHVMPEEWKVKVVEAIEVRGIPRIEIAKRCHVTPGAITKALKPVDQGGARASSFAPIIGEIVGIPLPTVPAGAEFDEVVEALREIRSVSPAVYNDLIADLFALLGKIRKLRRKPRRKLLQ